MKNLIIICFAGVNTNGILTREELRRIKRVNDDLRKGILSKFIRQKNTTIYCGNNEEEDPVLRETLNILNPKNPFSVGEKTSFIIRKIDFLSRRNSGRSASKQSYFVNEHLKRVYFSQKILQPEIVLMSETGMKAVLSHLTNGPGYSCPEDFLAKEIPVGTVVNIRIPQKKIEAILID